MKLLCCWVMDVPSVCCVFTSTWKSVAGSLMVLVISWWFNFVSRSFVARYALYVRSTASKSFSTWSFYIPFIIAPCSINVPFHAIHSWWDDIKSKNIIVMHCFQFRVQVIEREDKTLKLCRAQLRLGWGAPEYCREKLCKVNGGKNCAMRDNIDSCKVEPSWVELHNSW